MEKLLTSIRMGGGTSEARADTQDGRNKSGLQRSWVDLAPVSPTVADEFLP